MKPILAGLPVALGVALGSVALVAGSSVALAQGTIVPEADQQQQQPITQQAQPATQAPATATTAPATAGTQGTTTATPAPAPAVPAVPAQGQWVYTDQYGWIWVPEGSTTVYVQEQPYVYLYTPAYGWTWYGSPWGPGRYYYGPWVHHVWGAPRVWHRGGWYAPHVVVHPRVYAAPHVYRGGSYGHRGGHR